MTTQYEREQQRRANAARRLLALVDAVDALLGDLRDPSLEVTNRVENAVTALSADILNARLIVQTADEDRDRKARDKEAQQTRAGKVQTLDLLQDPPRCAAEVADAGRWIHWHQCNLKSRWLIPYSENGSDPVNTPVCGTHRSQWVKRGRLQYGVHRG